MSERSTPPIEPSGEAATGASGTGPLVIRPLDGGPNEVTEADWRRCRAASGADPLFMGRHWMTAWWDVFGAAAEATWKGIAVEDQAGETVGICPVFLQRGRVGSSPLPIRRLGILGSFFRGPGTVLTQYNQLLGPFEDRRPVLTTMLDYLDGLGEWSELCLQLAPEASLDALRDEAARRGWHVREVPSLPSYVVRTEGTFAEYCASLSPSVRRRLVNQRRRLAAAGDVELSYVEPAEASGALERMNGLYAKRAGAPAFDARALRFHERFLTGLPDTAELRLSQLSVDGTVVSVNYAVRVEDREYGIALGFDDGFDRRVSLGTLHLGYALEHAWRDGVVSYDLMTSPRGAHEWKARLATATLPLVGVQIVRRSWLAALYRVHDRFNEPWIDEGGGAPR